MPQLTYAEILEQVKKEGGLEAALKGTSATGTGFGGEGESTASGSGAFNPQDLVGRSIEIEVQQLPVIDFPMEDLSYSQEVTRKQGGAEAVQKQLSIKTGGTGGLFINNFTRKTGQIVINSSRVLINADKDYLMLFGKNIAIASTGPVNIDSGDSVTLFGERGLFLGVPNKGEAVKSNPPAPKLKSDPIPNQDYEPLVLGTKLAELLDDMLVILKNANIITPTGKAYFLEDTQYELACLQSRIPEILSTYAYIDGISHQQSIKPAPTPPEKVTPYPTKLIGTITALGESTLGTTTANPAPTSPITSPLKDVPGFYDSVDNLYNIPGI